MFTKHYTSRSPLRVLLVSPLPPPHGGIVRWTVLLLGWVEGQSGVTVRHVDTAPRWRAVEDLVIWKRVLGGGLQGIRDAWRVLVAMLVFRPHVLHLNTSAQLRGPWDTLMLAWATLLRVRSVYHIRMGRMPLVMKNHGWEWWGLRWALKLADRVVILDLASEQALKGFLPARRVVRMPNAIAVQPVANGQALVEPPSVLYLGHLIPTKGIEELMEAWRELRPQGWRLRLAGQGSAAYQRELLRNVGPDAGVEFLGALRPEAAWSRMQSAYIFVLPTHTEGFPNVILEAMAAGKAIISTRVGAIPEMLDADENEPCGLVITPRDAGALAAALRDLMAAPELRETLGRRAQVKVARSYTTDVVFEQLLHLWNDTARRRASIDRQSCSVAVK